MSSHVALSTVPTNYDYHEYSQEYSQHTCKVDPRRPDLTTVLRPWHLEMVCLFTGESSLSLSIELALKSWNSRFPMLSILDFNDKDGPECEWNCSHLHDLNDEVGTFRIIKKATLRSDYVLLGGGEEGCEDCSPRPIPYIFSGRGVCGIAL